jgi:hypothetical protein
MHEALSSNLIATKEKNERSNPVKLRVIEPRLQANIVRATSWAEALRNE